VIFVVLGNNLVHFVKIAQIHYQSRSLMITVVFISSEHYALSPMILCIISSGGSQSMIL
jgi:hypothetical protein